MSLREYLTFLESVSLELCTYDVDHFYFLGRIIMVKDERHLDKFDRAFSKTFAGIESLSITDLIDSLDVPEACLLYTSPSPRDQRGSRMPSSA